MRVWRVRRKRYFQIDNGPVLELNAEAIQDLQLAHVEKRLPEDGTPPEFHNSQLVLLTRSSTYEFEWAFKSLTELNSFFNKFPGVKNDLMKNGS